MSMRTLTTALLMLLLSSAQTAPAAPLELAVLGGVPVTLGADLDISQRGHPDLDLSPEFRSEPFRTPEYYVLRVGWTRPSDTWALDFVHHKLILDNPTAEVSNFTVTHGFNILSAMYLQEMRGWRLMGGLGVVVAHPENTVRGLSLPEDDGLGDSGYYLTGPVAQVGVGREITLREHLLLVGEARLIASRADVPIVDGEARIREISAHFLVGLAYRFSGSTF